MIHDASKVPRPPARRKQYAFGQRLRDQAATRGSKSGPQGEFAAAVRAADEHQVGDVDTHNQEQHPTEPSSTRRALRVLPTSVFSSVSTTG